MNFLLKLVIMAVVVTSVIGHAPSEAMDIIMEEVPGLILIMSFLMNAGVYWLLGCMFGETK